MRFPSEGPAFKNNNFDVVRFVLAFGVLWAHSILMAPRASVHSFNWTYNIASSGADWFFFLSGFLITASWLNSKSPYDFFLKRIKRVFPAFIVVGLICNFVVAPLASQGALSITNLHWTLLSIIRILTLHGFYSNLAFVGTYSQGIINGSLWTVRYEFLCYVMVAVLGWFGLLRRISVLAGLTVLLFLWWNWPHSQFARLRIIKTVFGEDARYARFFFSFLLGTLYYLLRTRIIYSAFIACGCLIAGVACYAPHETTISPLTILLLSYPMMYLAYAEWLPLQNFGKWGDFSYGVYIWGWPVQAMAVFYFRSLTPFALFFLASALALFLGIASWYLIERPFLNRRHQSAREHHVVESDAEADGGETELAL